MSDLDAPTDAAIELRLWRQFLTLAETLHFGRAAAQLHMTQPPLSLAMQQLERRLGHPVFERSRRGVALTAAGAALVEPVRQLLRQAAALPAVASAASLGETGRVRLGFVSTVGFGPLPGWLLQFRDANPAVSVALREATGDVQLAAFAQRELDAGFLLHAPGMAPDGSTGLQRLSLGGEPLLLALPTSLPWSSAVRLKAATLLAQPLVIFPRLIAPSLYDAVLAFYHRHGVTPTIAQEAIQMQTIVNLVSAGLGLAWVPRSMTLLQRAGVVYRPLPAALADAAPRSETSLVWPADAPPAVLRFVDFVRERSARPRAA
ncbi:MAG: LysR family transcriptional regulator [Methylibium sp. NZG]|nr:MAG: LysR family transcriptional regulator [Methylibium sp. NZG]